MSHLLTKEEIFSADDLIVELVACPEWGGHVYVKTFTSRERDAWERGLLEANEGESSEKNAHLINVRARLAAQVICDESGVRLFTDEEAEQLGDRSAKAMSRCFDVASRLNGITENDIEELAKN